MTLQSLLKSPPVSAAFGVALFAAAVYFLGNKIPLLNNLGTAFDGHRSDNTFLN